MQGREEVKKLRVRKKKKGIQSAVLEMEMNGNESYVNVGTYQACLKALGKCAFKQQLSICPETSLEHILMWTF